MTTNTSGSVVPGPSGGPPASGPAVGAPAADGVVAGAVPVGSARAIGADSEGPGEAGPIDDPTDGDPPESPAGRAHVDSVRAGSAPEAIVSGPRVARGVTADSARAAPEPSRRQAAAGAGPIVVSAIAFVREDGKVLTVRKRGTSVFMLPGGKPEAGETPLQTAIREVDEELGIVVDPAELRLLGEFGAAAANEAGRAVRATVYVTRVPVDPVVRAELEELRWENPSRTDPTVSPLNREHIFPRLLGTR